MQQTIPMSLFIPQPVCISADAWRQCEPRAIIGRIRYDDLCRQAGLMARVSGPALDREILVLESGEHTRIVHPTATALAVVMPKFDASPEQALRVLEVLAYGFHDYAARECVCGRGLFRPVRPRGRPFTGKALTAAARTRRARQNPY